MIHDVLVPIAYADGDDAALAMALALADRTGAHLAVLVCAPLMVPLTFEWTMFPADLYQRVQDAERARAQAMAARCGKALSASSVRSEVRVVETDFTSPARIAAMHARHADLAVVAGPGGDAPGWSERIFLDLLFDSGRPVLVVPAGYAQRGPRRHAVVAWQPTREAARAVHDALPLLRLASSVDVLVVDPVVDDLHHGASPGADIAAHLARHGLGVRVVVRASGDDDGDAADAIIRHATDTGAELVVAGGYSHARVREALLGGATRTLLRACPVPVLMSH